MKARKINSTHLFLTTLKIFTDKRTLTLQDIRKGYWFLLIARTYGLLSWKWIDTHVYKLDQDNQILEGLSFTDPSVVSDFLWKGNLYSYSPYGNEITPLSNVTKLQSFKYEVAQKKRMQTRKERMKFTPWQSLEFTALQTSRIIELIVKHTRKLSVKIDIGQKEREELEKRQNVLEKEWEGQKETQNTSINELKRVVSQLEEKQKEYEKQFDYLNKNFTVQLKNELTALVKNLVISEIDSKLDDIAQRVYALNRENRERFRRKILEETKNLRLLVETMNKTVNGRIKELKLKTGNNTMEILTLNKVVKEMNVTTTALIKEWSAKVLNNSERITEESSKLKNYGNKKIENRRLNYD